MEENLTDKLKQIEEAIYSYPLSLLNITNQSILNIIDDFLPYSVGMEFECHMKSTYDINNFKNIPDIISVSVDASEQRYRIPSGLKGMICLYNICTQLKINSAIDPGSSNHYHFDMTDVWDLLPNYHDSNPSRQDYINPILEELKTWGTALNYSLINGWYRWNNLQTLEIRIGEPSFEYNVIINRLIQGSNITKRLKAKLTSTQNERKIIQLEAELSKLKEQTSVQLTEEQIEMQRIINNRNIRL